MLRTINVAERNIYPGVFAPVTVSANTSTTVIPDQTLTKMTEIASRYIQNVGSNNMYYALGYTASASAYNGILQPYQQLDVSQHRLSVSAFSTGGTTVAITVLYRNDIDRNMSLIPTV